MDYKTMMKMEEEARRFEIEKIILDMANIVYENRKLRRELEEAKKFEEKYYDLVNQSYKNAQENTACLFKTILDGAFATKED